MALNRLPNLLRSIHYILLVGMCSFLISSAFKAQNQQWYFGYAAGLDFNTTPPTPLLNGKTHAPEGCASISDSTGNLLFYTSSDTVWNKNHQIMANGLGLLGHQSSTQSALILRKPGSVTEYFIFTTDSGTSTNGLRYSVVDMSLAAGMGSVTVKNILLHAPSSERLAATRHCDGKDIWILSHVYNSNMFKAYLLTSSGVNPNPVNSQTGMSFMFNPGQMKISKSGKRVVMAFAFHPLLQLFDFDNTSGALKFLFNLPTLDGKKTYGTEFSPDGSKLYATGCLCFDSDRVLQWDLCHSDSNSVKASKQTIYTSSATSPYSLFGSMQLGPDDKIYIARGINAPISSQPNGFLSVIQQPNQAGISSNYVNVGVNLGNNFSFLSLPSQILSLPVIPPFAFNSNTNSCTVVSFSAPALFSYSSPSLCTQLGYSLTGLQWDFGDPLSGPSNTSSLTSPVHVYSANGVYIPKLTIQYSCGGSTVVQSQTVVITAAPPLSVSNTTLCVGQSTVLTATGAQSYTWNTGIQTASISVTPSISSVYTVNATNPPGLCLSTSQVTVIMSECTDLPEDNRKQVDPVFFPNPVESNLSINLQSDKQCRLISALGIEWRRVDLHSGLNHLDVQGLAAGVYYLVLTDETGNTQTYKLVKLQRP